MKNMKKRINTKTYIIQVKPVREVLKDFADTYEKLRKGQKVKPVEKVTFPNIEIFRKFVTKKRIELLRVIKNNKPDSIKELGRMTKRDYKSINVDLEILKKADLVSLKKEDNKVRPVVDYKEIDIKIPIEL